MPHNWEDPSEVRNWDEHPSRYNPTRPEQLDILVSVVADLWRPGDWLLDLGCGSGQVEELLFTRLPAAGIVGIDSSSEMMRLAKARLAGRAFEPLQHDLADLGTLAPPPHPYRCALAVQSLHHLSAPDMAGAYRWLHGRLEPGGVFLLLDRLRVEDAATWSLLQPVWRRQDRLLGSRAAEREGADFAAHTATVAERGDRPVLLEEHLAWLRAAGFAPACLHLHGNRALIAGRRP